MTKGTQIRIVRQHLRHLAREAITLQRTARRITVAKGNAACTAIQYGHYLGRWLDDPGRPDHQVATCLKCGVGADVDLGSGDLSVSELLRETCQQKHFSRVDNLSLTAPTGSTAPENGR